REETCSPAASKRKSANTGAVPRSRSASERPVATAAFNKATRQSTTGSNTEAGSSFSTRLSQPVPGGALARLWVSPRAIATVVGFALLRHRHLRLAHQKSASRELSRVVRYYSTRF